MFRIGKNNETGIVLFMTLDEILAARSMGKNSKFTGQQWAKIKKLAIDLVR